MLFFDQPATPLAFLYAAVLAVSHAVAPPGGAGLVEDVWRYPETDIGRIHAGLAVLLFAASFAAGVLVWRRTRSIAAGIALQTGLIVLTALATSAASGPHGVRARSPLVLGRDSQFPARTADRAAAALDV